MCSCAEAAVRALLLDSGSFMLIKTLSLSVDKRSFGLLRSLLIEIQDSKMFRGERCTFFFNSFSFTLERVTLARACLFIRETHEKLIVSDCKVSCCVVVAAKAAQVLRTATKHAASTFRKRPLNSTSNQKLKSESGDSRVAPSPTSRGVCLTPPPKVRSAPTGPRCRPLLLALCPAHVLLLARCLALSARTMTRALAVPRHFAHGDLHMALNKGKGRVG